ncbi:hypothetical protein GCM10010423_65340 [Streptomyces levis]|uniref:Portal protein n=1 Tax=Streptomyces levis TaxID=285566 RepID=A0ABN3P3Q7_9ACTN
MSTEKVDLSKAGGRPKTTGAPIGLTGLVHQAGQVQEEFLPQLRGQKAVQTYKEMSDNDPIVASMLFAIDMFLRKVEWRVQPAGEDEKSKQDAKFLEECKDDMSTTWPDFISEVNTMLSFGWSYFEILYKRRSTAFHANTGNQRSKYNDNKIGWRKFDPRSQDSLDRWVFDAEGGIMGMVQRPAPDYNERFIPIGKSLLFRTTSRKNNPEGRSVLRAAYRPWYFKKRIEEIEGVGVERDLAGLPMATVPARFLSADATEQEKAMVNGIRQLVSNVRRDRQEGVIWPQDWDEKNNPQYSFQLLNSGGTRQFDTTSIITRYEQRMAMTVLADFILTGHDSTGSFALATSKSGMFQASLGAWLDIIKDTLNNYAVPRLFRLNGVEGPYPTFEHDHVQQPSLADLATFVAALAGAGAQLFPDTELENHFRSLAQLPVREDKDTDSQAEQDLRNSRLAAEIEQNRATEKQAKNPQLFQQIQGMQRQQQMQTKATMGKDPNSKPGAPTKTTGAVKSKLPPQQRRDTRGARVASNTIQKSSVHAKQDPSSEYMKNTLAQTYPKEVLDWVDEAVWYGPLDVNLDQVQMARRPGGRDMSKVVDMAKKIDSGDTEDFDPVVLVMTPDFKDGEGKLKIADGYHRTLGYQHSNQDNIPAYVGIVQEKNGPWDREMHDAKLNKRDE